MATDAAAAGSIATVAEKALVTAERKVCTDLDGRLHEPYVPRAMVAPDMENVNGTRGHKHQDMSVLLFGWGASKMEWGVLYFLAKDENGDLSKIKRLGDVSMEAYSTTVLKLLLKRLNDG